MSEAPTTTMRTEIGEQPVAVARTIAAVGRQRLAIRRLATDARAVLFFARGSSDNAATYGRYLCEMRAGIMTASASPSIWTSYGASLDLHGVLAVGVSQSGHTEELVECLEAAGRQGARTIAVSNSAGSPLTRVADLSLVTEAGTERAVPATKSYTSQLAALAMLADSLSDRVDGFSSALEHVPEQMQEWLDGSPDVSPIVDMLDGASAAMVAGNGLTVTTATEIALKLKETCYLLAEGLSGGDLLHGPVAALDPSTPALLLDAGGPTTRRLELVRERVRAVGAPIAAIGPADDPRPGEVGVRVPQLREELMPFALVVPGQLVAERLATRRGINPDAPRGLSKVTQTDAG